MFQVQMYLHFFCYAEICIHTIAIYYKNKGISVTATHFAFPCRRGSVFSHRLERQGSKAELYIMKYKRC